MEGRKVSVAVHFINNWLYAVWRSKTKFWHGKRSYEHAYHWSLSWVLRPRPWWGRRCSCGGCWRPRTSRRARRPCLITNQPGKSAAARAEAASNKGSLGRKARKYGCIIILLDALGRSRNLPNWLIQNNFSIKLNLVIMLIIIKFVCSKNYNLPLIHFWSWENSPICRCWQVGLGSWSGAGREWAARQEI